MPLAFLMRIATRCSGNSNDDGCPGPTAQDPSGICKGHRVLRIERTFFCFERGLISPSSLYPGEEMFARSTWGRIGSPRLKVPTQSSGSLTTAEMFCGNVPVDHETHSSREHEGLRLSRTMVMTERGLALAHLSMFGPFCTP